MRSPRGPPSSSLVLSTDLCLLRLTVTTALGGLHVSLDVSLVSASCNHPSSRPTPPDPSVDTTDRSAAAVRRERDIGALDHEELRDLPLHCSIVHHIETQCATRWPGAHGELCELPSSHVERETPVMWRVRSGWCLTHETTRVTDAQPRAAAQRDQPQRGRTEPRARARSRPCIKTVCLSG